MRRIFIALVCVALLTVGVARADAPSLRADGALATVGGVATWYVRGGESGWRYAFRVSRDGEPVCASDEAGAADAFTCRVDAPGVYEAYVVVTDGHGRTFEIAGDSVVASELILSVYIYVNGATIFCKASAQGGGGAYQYHFDLRSDGASVSQSAAYSAADMATFIAPSAGEYSVRATVRDATGMRRARTSESVDVDEPAPLGITYIASTVSGTLVSWHAEIEGGTGDTVYSFEVLTDDATVYGPTPFSSLATLSVDLAPGSYRARVIARDSANACASATSETLVLGG